MIRVPCCWEKRIGRELGTISLPGPFSLNVARHHFSPAGLSPCVRHCSCASPWRIGEALCRTAAATDCTAARHASQPSPPRSPTPQTGRWVSSGVVGAATCRRFGKSAPRACDGQKATNLPEAGGLELVHARVVRRLRKGSRVLLRRRRARVSRFGPQPGATARRMRERREVPEGAIGPLQTELDELRGCVVGGVVVNEPA